MPRKNVRFVTSNIDLFESCHSIFYETSSDYTESPSSYNTRSRQQHLPNISNQTQPSIPQTLPDYSSFEKFELVVESETEKENVKETDDMSVPIKEQQRPLATEKPTLSHADDAKLHAPAAAVCSTPATRVLLPAKNVSENHGVSLGDIQATPITVPIFNDAMVNSIPYIQFEKMSMDGTPNRMKNGFLESMWKRRDVSPCQTGHRSQLNATGDHSINRLSKHSDALVKRLSRRLRIDNMILNQSYWELYDAGDAKATLMKICQQTTYKRFADVFTAHRRQNVRKIGEGCFGEVFACPVTFTKMETLCTEELVAVKLVPVDGKTRFNGDTQKTFSEVLSEVIVSKELTALSFGFTNRTEGFVQLKNVHLVRGAFPGYLTKAWERYDEEKNSENDHPRIFPRSQIWVAIETLYSGQALENSIPSCPFARLSIVQQVAMTLAVAEADLKFEHRDLHWGNVLVRYRSADGLDVSQPPPDGHSCSWCKENSTKETTTSCLTFRVENREYRVPTYGVSAVIIDFTLSRLEQNSGLVYVDLSADPGLFESEGDYQFDIYRIMRTDNGNQWQQFSPLSNIRWLHYLVHQLLLDRDSTDSWDSHCQSRHDEAWSQLVELHQHLNTPDCLPRSAYRLVADHPLFVSFRQIGK